MMKVDIALQTNGNIPSYFWDEIEGDTFKEAAFNAMKKYVPEMEESFVETLHDKDDIGYLYDGATASIWVWPYVK